MHPKNLSIRHFSYVLPEERIAYHPLPERDASRLLIYEKGSIAEDQYCNIAQHLPSGSLLLLNNTRVVEARLLFQKTTGGLIEIFCLDPGPQYSDIVTAMQQTGSVQWKCLIGGASKWKAGQLLEKKINTPSGEILLTASYIEKQTECFLIELRWSPAALSFAEMLHAAGAIPLPPYIKRAVETNDTERYQTVYAEQDGSVAAPTAGLHFTQRVFESLAKKNINTEYLTLHVGAGTFKPVKAEQMADHEMHAEFICINRTTIENLLHQLEATIVTVGTTSLRSTESLYWLGVKTMLDPGIEPAKLWLSQWEVYEMETTSISPAAALGALLQWMEKKGMDTLITRTQIIIAPGYRPRIANGLVTNFHQPQSTLLLLIAALIGENWKKAYEYALANEFRFLSYGDGSLLWFDTTA